MRGARRGGTPRPFARAPGLELDATFPATKIGWVLDHVDGRTRRAPQAGELVVPRRRRVADPRTWRASTSVTRATPAGRCSARSAGATGTTELLELFGVPRALLPPIVDSDGAGSRLTAALGRAASRRRRARRPAGVTVRPRLHRAGHREGHARDGRVHPRLRRARPPPRPPPGVLARARGAARSDELRARGVRAGRGRGARLVRRARRPSAGPRRSMRCSPARAPREGSVACVPALQGFGTPSWDAPRAERCWG